jgi:hypothetical protein
VIDELSERYGDDCGFGDQVSVVSAWRVDEGVMVSLAA